MLIGFVLMLSTIAMVIKKNIINGNMEYLYQKCLNSTNSKYLYNPDDSTFCQYKMRYNIELKLITEINLINAYKKRYKFDYNLNKKLDSSNKVYSKYINEAKKLFKTQNYNKEYRKWILQKVENSKSIRKKPLYIFPVEIQGEYLSHKIINHWINEFSDLAAGSKIYISYFANSVINSIGKIGLFFLISLTIIISFWLTFKVTQYNEKFDKLSNTGFNYFYTFIAILGFFITFLSLI